MAIPAGGILRSPANIPGRRPPLLRSAVSFVLPNEPIFVGSYHRVAVRVSPASHLAFDDLVFKVSNPAGGTVSLSRDALFSTRAPSILLLAGARPGTYTLAAYKAGGTTPLGTAKFTVTHTWRNTQQGPSLWFEGPVGGYAPGAAWGGGPAGPQNENVFPQSGTKRIAILLIDTASQRYPTDGAAIQAIKDRWANEVINGVPFGGSTRSTAEYYREASFNILDLSAVTFGPFSLPDAIDTYINADGSMGGTFPQSAITAAASSVDFDDFDNILFVMRSRDAVGATPRYAAWPYSSIGHWGPYTTNQGPKSFGFTSMPNDWHESDGREIHATFAHEFGHTLGLSDQYTPSVAGLNLDDWELMDFESNLPFFSIAHRMMLGWLPATDIHGFDFSTAAVPVDETVTLAAIELAAPAGMKRGVEVRIADGRNYYFEYRVGESSEIGDRALPTDSRVLGTDVVSDPGTAPVLRPVILRLPQHPGDDGAVLGNGNHYAEIDGSDGLEFRADVSGIDGIKADLRIRYGANGRPDPSIRPWPASADRQWQSPDIEVRNARSLADPANFFNVPWLNQDNEVIATVRNNGTLDAPGVLVNFFVKDYNVGGTPEFFLGSATQDVPHGGGPVEFIAHWVPPAAGHFCIVVRIALYQTPGSASIVEQTEFNNIAQSNYTRFNSATKSPASREMASVAVGNPYSQRTRVFITAGQSRPDFRTYLETTWLWLDAGETRQIMTMMEYAGPAGKADDKPRERVKPNDVGVVAFIEDPRVSPRHALGFHGGIQAQVATGRATDIIRFNAKGGTAVGLVVASDTQAPVPGGSVLLAIGIKDRRTYRRVELDNGAFKAGDIPRAATVQAHYLPAPGFSESESEIVKVD